MPKLARIRVIGTGGTIAGESKSSSDASYEAGTLAVADLLGSVDGLDELAAIESETLFAKGSEDLGPTQWIALARRLTTLARQDDVDGMVVTHGSDTLEEAAFFLDLVLDVDKPVVLTAAMRAATALSADGPANIYQAVQACTAQAPGERNVLVVLNGQIITGWQAIKTDSVAFESFQAYPGAPVGRIIGNRMQVYSRPLASPLAGEFAAFLASAPDLPDVGIAYVFGGCGEAPLAALRARGCKGIVVAAFGAGTIPEPMAKLAAEMADAGCVIVISSRVQNVSVLPDTMTLRDGRGAGIIAARILNPQKSALLLRLCLAASLGAEAIDRHFDAFAAQSL